MRVKIMLGIGSLLLALAATGCGGGSTDCKSACSKLSSCGLKSSGLSCDSNCQQGDCAVCVNDRGCDEIAAGQCAASCPGVSFTKK
jgi:hypothetical protein